MATVVLLSVGAVLFLAAGCIWYGRRPPGEKCYFFGRCPKCNQKLRFLAEKAGKRALCPRCKEPWTLPAAAQRATAAPAAGHDARVGFGRLVRRQH